MDAASEGKEALDKSDPVSAIQHFTRALTQLPRAPKYYIQRATAYSRVKPADGGPNPEAALRDAEIALVLAIERGKRELMLAAQMRRAVSLFQLERYGDARFLFERIESKTDALEVPKVPGQLVDMDAAVLKLKAKKKAAIAELPIWMIKVRRKLSELGDGDEKATVSVVEYPSDTEIPTEEYLKDELERLQAGQPARAVGGTTQVSTQQSSTTPAPAVEQKKDAADSVAPPAPAKVRHEWYQSQDSVVVTLYVKGIPKEKVETDLKDESVSLQFPLPSGSEYAFTLDPLYAPVDTAASAVTVMGTKIEIVLKKQTPGQKWSALEASGTTTKLADRPATPATPTAGPAYPTSSRKGAKDWDKVASSLTAKKPKGEKGKDAGNESDDSEYGGDAVDGFFKKLYAGADPDTRRAMMKSFVESEGTSLSTNWSEVGETTMKPHHPN